jgi:mutual gliding-motility protein MglA
MAELDEKAKTLTVKIVYYGPAMSGKTTNLIHLHDVIRPSLRGDMMSLETQGDRTLYFDLLPLGVQTATRYTVVFKLFTVPGQVAHDATRKAVLARSDGVVFVADSQTNQAVNNMDSFDNLEKNTQHLGMDFETLPLVVQFNKRDLEHIDDERKILDLWGPTGIPVYFASALHGKGVTETFEEILRRCYGRLDSTLGLKNQHGILASDFMNILTFDS